MRVKEKILVQREIRIRRRQDLELV
jgi:hypothetical protein